MEKLFSSLFGFAIVLAISILVSCLATFIIMDVAELFDLTFIAELSFVQVFGAMMIWGLMKMKMKVLEDSDEFDLGESFAKYVLLCIIYLVFWGLAYISHWAITL